MKTVTKFFPLMVVLLIIGMAGNVNAQGRGHHKGHERNHQHNNGHHNDHDWKYDRGGDGHHYNNYDRRHHPGYEVRRVVHHRHAPVVVHHYAARPRYIYYRDYDVYYDTRNSVYISYSGRNWTVSANLPVALHHVDVHRAVRMEVAYEQDDFPRYLERSRPSYRRIYTGF